MATWQNIGGTWRSGVWWQNVFGTWRQVQVWQNVGGIWKQLSTLFTPDGGTVDRSARYDVAATLSCNTPATWTYSLSGGVGASTPSGTTTTSITFSLSAGGATGNRTTRNGSATVTGVSNGVSRSFTVSLTAEGDNV